MATHQLAQGLASLGRHGDSMLMHVSPAEVEGLSALGKMTGHKLHTNPNTGMPEAFDFGDFFSSLLPMAAGLAWVVAHITWVDLQDPVIQCIEAFFGEKSLKN
jgi:hypothetical protein